MLSETIKTQALGCLQLELRPVMNDPNVNFNPFIFLSNAGAAFALNMSVFMLIGKTSALTMNVAGVIKAWPPLMSPKRLHEP